MGSNGFGSLQAIPDTMEGFSGGNCQPGTGKGLVFVQKKEQICGALKHNGTVCSNRIGCNMSGHLHQPVFYGVKEPMNRTQIGTRHNIKMNNQEGINVSPDGSKAVISIRADRKFYRDHVDPDNLWYIGRGQVGDQVFRGKNESLASAHSIHVYVKIGQFYYYQGLYKLMDVVYETDERDERMVFKFRLCVLFRSH